MSVSTGYVKKHESMEMITKICFKNITIEGKTYQPNEYKELSDDFDLDSLQDLTITAESDQVSYELHNDIGIDFKSGEGYYIKDPAIKVGNPTVCIIGIYVAAIGEFEEVEIEESTIMALLNWKHTLVIAGRLDPNIKFASMKNCCT